MDFGAVVYSAAEARGMEELGFSFIGRGDDLTTFTGLMEIAQATERCEFGSFIMTAYGRHPAVTARETARIQEIAGGRLKMCIGRGFRSAALLGRDPIPLGETRAYVDALRAIIAGRATEWSGHTIQPIGGVRPVPVYVSAYGPQVRRLAGATGDGVVLAGGSSIPLLRSFITDVADGAESVGRTRGDLDVWMLCRVSVRPTRAEALEDVRGLLAASAYRHLRSASQLATLDADVRARLEEFQQRYDAEGFEGYQPSWNGPNARLVQELGLDELLAERFAIVGTPDDVRRQVSDLAAEGISRIVVAPGPRGNETLYERIAHALIVPRSSPQ